VLGMLQTQLSTPLVQQAPWSHWLLVLSTCFSLVVVSLRTLARSFVLALV
jgi:hypothetical protein